MFQLRFSSLTLRWQFCQPSSNYDILPDNVEFDYASPYANFVGSNVLENEVANDRRNAGQPIVTSQYGAMPPPTLPRQT